MAARKTHCQQPAEVEDIFIKPALDGASIDVTIKKSCTQKEKLRYPYRYYRQTNGGNVVRCTCT